MCCCTWWTHNILRTLRSDSLFASQIKSTSSSKSGVPLFFVPRICNVVYKLVHVPVRVGTRYVCGYVLMNNVASGFFYVVFFIVMCIAITA